MAPQYENEKDGKVSEEGMECKCSSFNTQGTEGTLSDSGWENFSFPLSNQFLWEELWKDYSSCRSK